jgi:adenosine deaminase
MDFENFLRKLPKVDLHCHLAGTLRPTTMAELAAKHGVTLPRPPAQLYEFADFYDFIDILRRGAQVVVDQGDFARVTYEALQDGVEAGNLKHAELFFNPQYFYPNGTTYRTMLDGMIEGLVAAERDFAVSGLLIACVDRQIDPGAAMQILDDVLADRRDRVVGIGLDGPERAGPPAGFGSLYRRAGQAGLLRTAHVCEDNQSLAEAPPRHYEDCCDLLGCDRLDHGYNLLADPRVVARARDEGRFFTTCTVTSVSRNLERRAKSIARMVELGLNVTVNTDDPQMFHTDIADCYVRLFRATGWDVAQAVMLSLNGVAASWLPDAAKRTLTRQFETEIAALQATLA